MVAQATIMSFDPEPLPDITADGAGRPSSARGRGPSAPDAATARPGTLPGIGRERTPADEVDLAGMDSFPASDPPGFWTQDPPPRS